MVKCIQTYTLILPPTQCSSREIIIRKAAFLFRQSKNNISLFFRHPQGSQTQIESDADLLSLKYIVKKNQIEFSVKISKSKEEIEKEIIQETVGEYLESTYQQIAEEQFERQINQEIERYLDTLYKRLAAKEEKEIIKRIEQDQVSNYLGSMTEQIVGRRIEKKIPVRERRSRMLRVSPEKELFKRKESNIEMMVGRILESMMPVMVKELSYRIVEELKYQKDTIKAMQRELNPQEY